MKKRNIELVKLGGDAAITISDSSDDYGIPTVELRGSIEQMEQMLPDTAERLGLALIFAAKSARR